MTFADILLTIFDIALLVMFETALSSIVCMFLKSQGAISTVATLVSSMYGFICGAYMPLSQFSEGLRNILMFLPGTYGTGLLRNHMMSGVLTELQHQGLPSAVVTNLSKAFDASLTFFEKNVSVLAMYLIVVFTVIVCISIFILLNFVKKTSKKLISKNDSLI